MILCQAIHEPLRFISFLPGNLRTTLAYVRGWISGGRQASTLLTYVSDFSRTEERSGILCLLFRVYFIFVLLFHIGSNQLQGGSIFHLTLPHWLSMGPFRKDLSSTDWNIISCWTSTLALLRCAPCNSLTTAPSYLLVTWTPLVQYTYGISFQQAEGARGINANILSVWNSQSERHRAGFSLQLLLCSKINSPEERTWHFKHKRKASEPSQENRKRPPPCTTIFKEPTNQSSLRWRI